MTADGGPAAFARGLTELDRYLFELRDAALPHAVEAFRSAVAFEPAHTTAWIALGFALDAANNPQEALTAFQQAARLDADDHEVEVFVITLLSETGAEREALAALRVAAFRIGVDLEALERQLSDAGFPIDSDTLLRNGFIRARNFLRSRLEDEIDRMRRDADPVEWQRLQGVERQVCFDMQVELEGAFDLARVPPHLRELSSLAIRLGIGDDACRAMVAEALTRTERQRVVQDVDERAHEIQSWIETFQPGSLSTEAAAFMYLLLCAEEIHGAQ